MLGREYSKLFDSLLIDRKFPFSYWLHFIDYNFLFRKMKKKIFHDIIY